MSNITGSLSGIVTDINGNPIKNAVIKLTSISYIPLMHSRSTDTGNYLIGDITPGTYNVLCISNGTTLQAKDNVSITQNSTTTVNFTLIFASYMNLSLIMGTAIDSSTNNPISGAAIFLYQLDLNNNENLIGMMYTNDYGSFTFPKLQKGNYNIYGSAIGYDNNKKNISIMENQQMVSVEIPLILNPIGANGTMSGVIKDDAGEPINQGDVILYRVEPNSSLTPIAFTKTNGKGVYLFFNIPKGTYKIKSTQTKMI